MAYRNLKKHTGFPYTWKTQSEVIMNDDGHEHHDSDRPVDPLHSNTSPPHAPDPPMKSGLRHHKSTVMTGVRGAFSASASTVSLTATRLLGLKKNTHTGTLRDLENQTSHLDLSQNPSEETVVMDEDIEDPNAVISIEEFKGGLSWTCIDKSCRGLDLDLFCAHEPENPISSHILDLQDMAPLSSFRNLRSLKLTGMMQSYQQHIWRTVWMNPQLEDLELDMALEPSLHDEVLSSWFSIHGNWESGVEEDTLTRYFGDKGQGRLHGEFGFGEYLDKLAILNGKEEGRKLGGMLHRLPVVNLSLSGFVVDADPFFMWFNPNRLQTIKFKGQCVDAGFALPVAMRHVTVTKPETAPGSWETAETVEPQEFKLIELKHGEPLVYWDETEVGEELRKIKKHLAEEGEKKAEKKAKRGIWKGKEVDNRGRGEVQYMLNKAFPFNPSPPRRRRRLGFLSTASLATFK